MSAQDSGEGGINGAMSAIAIAVVIFAPISLPILPFIIAAIAIGRLFSKES